MFYGHSCSLDNDFVSLLKSGEKLKTGCKEISRKNPQTKHFFRSLSSIESERERHLRSKFAYIIHPLSMFRLYWDGIFCILFFFTLLIIPLNLFKLPRKVKLLNSNDVIVTGIIAVILDFISITDMVMTFFMGYGVAIKRKIVLNPRNIAINYLTGINFYLDLICSIPTYLVSEITIFFMTSENKYIDVQFFEYSIILKFLRIVKFLEYFNRSTQIFQKYFYIRTTLRFMLIIIILLHWFTCIVLMVELYFETNKDLVTTIENYISGSNSHSTNYLIGRYFQMLLQVTSYLLGSSLTSTVVYDGVVVRTLLDPLKFPTDYEMYIIFGIIGFILCNLLWVLVLQMVITLNSSETKYYAIICQLNKYMSYKELPLPMRNRILVYYDYRFQKKYFRENTILDMLSDTLKKEIYLHSCRTLIENVSLLKDLSQEIISDIVSNLKHEVFLYNDIIVKAGTPGDCMYFIANGTVAVLTPTEKEICHLQDGAYFGEIGLISRDQKRVADVVAIEICEIYRLDRKDFKRCFPLNSPHYKKMEQIAKERMEKTMLLEELHQKYIFDNTTKRTEANKEIIKDYL